MSTDFWLLNFLGKLHPMVVHFPITLLLLAAVLELFSLRNFHSRFRPGINVLVATGALAAMIAALLGWQLSVQEETTGSTLDIHQITGNTTAILGLLSAGLLFLIIRQQQDRYINLYRVVLVASALGVTIAGHFGAVLTHGDDYLTSTLPWSEDFQSYNKVKLTIVGDKQGLQKLSSAQQTELSAEVRGIFAHNCYKCHSSKKVKGELRLDQKHMAMKGGEDGPVIIPGRPDKSEIVRRIELPRSD